MNDFDLVLDRSLEILKLLSAGFPEIVFECMLLERENWQRNAQAYWAHTALLNQISGLDNFLAGDRRSEPQNDSDQPDPAPA